jgi:hypothetical protein
MVFCGKIILDLYQHFTLTLRAARGGEIPIAERS